MPISPHEQQGQQEQLSIGERYAHAANEHAIQILQGAEPDEMAFRSLAVLQTRGKLGEHTNEWNALDEEAFYLLADHLVIDRKDLDNIEEVQQAIVAGDKFPKSAFPRLAALLISGADLFNRTVEQSPEVIAGEERYHEGNIESLEARNKRRQQETIGETAIAGSAGELSSETRRSMRHPHPRGGGSRGR
ncbi:hypothetical protein A3F37_03660 [Candidatus Saccharibacteria bacterium RIFCSPHIGHO2_12_FULL_41_12]|nr:MAG: hypothetical protein A3F37_03660 [Candidatus Saccharibacteria bacterium RIFCSPHIGHO2_12_FULL_41_12]